MRSEDDNVAMRVKTSSLRCEEALVVVLALCACVVLCCGSGSFSTSFPTLTGVVQGSVVQGQVQLKLEGYSYEGEGAVRFFAHGIPVDKDLLPPFELWLDTEPLGDGPLQVEAYLQTSTDEGQEVWLASVDLVVDNYGPTIEIREPNAGACLETDSTVSIAADAHDDVSVLAVEFRVAGQPFAVFEGPPYLHATSVAALQQLVSLPADGTLAITVAAENARGLIADETVSVGLCSP